MVRANSNHPRIAASGVFLMFCGIALLAALAYFPVLSNGFVNWDDPGNVVNNQLIRSLAPGNILTFFKSTVLSTVYIPLVTLSFALDYRMYGLNPHGYHATNLLLHILNSILVLALLYYLTGDKVVACVASALFAVHPLHVESVAWVTGRTELLSAFFYLLSVISWCALIRGRGDSALGAVSPPAFLKMKYYWLSLIFFLCALLSKSMAISLPFILLLTDYYFGARRSPRSAGSPADGCGGTQSRRGEGAGGRVIYGVRDLPLAGLWSNKIPFFALSAIFSVVILIVSMSGETLRPPFHKDPLPAILIASRNCVWYVAKILIPIRLSAYYPYPATVSIFQPEFLFSLFATGFAAGTLFIARRKREISFGSLWYLITIFPVLQLIPVRDTMAADRYAYLPSIGIFYLIGILFSRIWKYCDEQANRPGEAGCAHVRTLVRIVPVGALTLVIAGLSLLTLQRCLIWRYDERLWMDVISKYPGAATAHNNLGLVYAGRNLRSKARAEFTRAVSLKADFAEPHINLGVLCGEEGDTDGAVRELKQAIALKSRVPDACRVLSIILDQQEKDAVAAGGRKKRDFAPSRNDLGLAYARSGMISEAIPQFEKAVQLDPGFAPAYYNLALCYFMKGDKDKADAYRSRAMKLGYPGRVSDEVRGP
ncbi:MAG: tetratricopeptide repeat protein [Candidatus Aureabacteria bacterium]|nr:tetratricopeptide repeat protein [Candidatus Auribacterota bacterium]